MEAKKILLDGYSDHNLGDDLMLYLAARELDGYDVYTPYKNMETDSVSFTKQRSGFDVYLKVTGSGFLIHNKLGVLYRLRDTRAEKRYAPLRAVIGCNISGFINGAARMAVNHQLRGYDLITVRDDYSYDYIRSNAPDVRCYKYPDMVLALPEKLIPRDVCGENLGISVRYGADAAVLAKIADGYVKRAGKGVTLLCLDSGAENDLKIARSVWEIAKYKEKIKTAVYKDIPSMLTQIKRCGVILGIRFHSIILAARMGIPFVPVAYSDKTPRAMEMLGYDGDVYGVHALDAEELLGAIMNVKPFAIREDIIASARNHILEFKRFVCNGGNGIGG